MYTYIVNKRHLKGDTEMELTVKRWIADKIDAEAKIYNYFTDVVYVNGYYADTVNDTVTYKDVEILKETEKAVQAAIMCGAVDGKVGRFKSWIPKSQIV